jgi:hypothetical protein
MDPRFDSALDRLFREARPFSRWLDKPVADETLRRCAT